MASKLLVRFSMSSVQLLFQFIAFVSTITKMSSPKALSLAPKSTVHHALNIHRSSFYQESWRKDLMQAGRTTLNHLQIKSSIPTTNRSDQQKDKQKPIVLNNHKRDESSFEAAEISPTKTRISSQTLLIPTTAGIRTFPQILMTTINTDLSNKISHILFS